MDKLTYEQRVRKMAEYYAIEYGHPDLTKERAYFFFSTDAKIAVAAQAEAIREYAIEESAIPAHSYQTVEGFLIENGYVPAPEVKDNIANFLDGKDINSPENG